MQYTLLSEIFVESVTRLQRSRQQLSQRLGRKPVPATSSLSGKGVDHMNLWALRNHLCRAAVLLVFTFGVCSANGANSPVSGTYEIVQKTDLGSQTKLLVRFHLTNTGPSPLSLQEVLFSDFAQPPVGGTITPSITLPPRTPEVISQQLVVPRLQYEQWQRGVLPRAVLEMKTSTGARVTQAIRLAHVPAGKGE